MRSLNKASLIGHVGSIDGRTTASGIAVTNVSIATNARDGKGNDVTEWHRCVFWDKLAGVVNDYLKIGDRVYVEGTLRTRSWDDDNGVTRFQTEMHVNELVMLGGKRDDAEPEPEPKAKAARKGSRK